MSENLCYPWHAALRGVRKCNFQKQETTAITGNKWGEVNGPPFTVFDFIPFSIELGDIAKLQYAKVS